MILFYNITIVYYGLIVVYSLVMCLSIFNNKIMKNKRNDTLANNIRAERNRKNISQAVLAEKVNASESTISLIERGMQTPSVFLVIDIAKVLDIDIKELLKGI